MCVSKLDVLFVMLTEKSEFCREAEKAFFYFHRRIYDIYLLDMVDVKMNGTSSFLYNHYHRILPTSFSLCTCKYVNLYVVFKDVHNRILDK